MSSSKENIQQGIEDFFKCSLQMNESLLIRKPRSLAEMHMNESEVEKQNLNPHGSNEASGADADKDISLDNGNREALRLYDECDRLKLAGLYGDYNGNVKKLLTSQCFHGFPYFTFILKELVGCSLNEWFQLNSRHFQFNPNGSMVLPAQNFSVHGNGPYVPPMVCYIYLCLQSFISRVLIGQGPDRSGPLPTQDRNRIR